MGDSLLSGFVIAQSRAAAAQLRVRRLRPFTMIQSGSTVRFAKMPPWVAKLPDDSRRVFEFCFGRTFRIVEVDRQGLFVLDVSAEIDERFGGFMNDIRLEVEFLEEIR